MRRILDLEFVEMAEVSVDDDTRPTPGRPPTPARPPITDISQWVERFSLMAAVLTTRFPEKAPEFFAYQALMVRAERNYVGNRWVTYDRQFRRQALAQRDLNWSVTDPHLYNEAFTGRARSIARCAVCLQDDHQAAACPKNPNHPLWPWLPEAMAWPQPQQPSTQQPSQPPPPPNRLQSTEVCRRFNEGRCQVRRCKYLHECWSCQGHHPYMVCTQRLQQRRSGGRSQSPLRPPQRGW